MFLFNLTRIKVFLPSLLWIFPFLLFISPQNVISYESLKVFFALLFLFISGFVFNDIEDAEDDTHDIEKKQRNSFSNRKLKRKQGILITLVPTSIGLILLYTLNNLVFLSGCLLVLFGILYSWKPVRLKSIPIIDVITHGMILCGFQFLILFFTFNPLDLQVLPLFIAIVPFWTVSQIFHQIKDYKVDKKTGIKNTVQKFGIFNLEKFIFLTALLMTIGFIFSCKTRFFPNEFIYFTPFAFLNILLLLKLRLRHNLEAKKNLISNQNLINNMKTPFIYFILIFFFGLFPFFLFGVFSIIGISLIVTHLTLVWVVSKKLIPIST